MNNKTLLWLLLWIIIGVITWIGLISTTIIKQTGNNPIEYIKKWFD